MSVNRRKRPGIGSVARAAAGPVAASSGSQKSRKKSALQTITVNLTAPAMVYYRMIADQAGTTVEVAMAVILAAELNRKLGRMR